MIPFKEKNGIEYEKRDIKEFNPDEKIKLLATDGMLVKRPIVVGQDYCACRF